MSEESGSKLVQPSQLAIVAPIEFTVIAEPWASYELEDGTKLFVKLVVAKVNRGFDQNGQPAYTLNSQNVVSSHVPEHLRGQPSTTPFNVADPSTFKVVASLDFDRVGQEQWNVYNLADGSVLKTRLEVSSVARIDKYGPDGDPVYFTQTQSLVRFKVSENVLKQAKAAIRKPDTKGPYA